MAEFVPVDTVEIDASNLIIMTLIPRKRAIVFRGVQDSTFGLIPTAFRPKGQMDLQKIAVAYVRNNSNAMEIKGELSQKQKEVIALLWFYDLANQQGIDLPNMPHLHIGDPFLESDGLMKLARLTDEFIEIRALAQHYGIPTRMLDWTFDINTAIYFAVRNIGPKDIEKHPEKKVSIWELDKSRLSWVSNDMRFVVPRYHENPNIRAQSGVLSQIVGNHDEDKLDEMNFEDAVGRMCESATGHHTLLLQEGNPPILRRYDVPYSDVPKLQNYLNSHGMGYDTYFPGLAGVAESIRRMSGIE